MGSGVQGKTGISAEGRAQRVMPDFSLHGADHLNEFAHHPKMHKAGSGASIAGTIQKETCQHNVNCYIQKAGQMRPL